MARWIRILCSRSIDNPIGNVSGFTMMEIAISLAIIGIALVAIIGVLPLGMNVQKENRESTIINQDATVFMGAIRSGARGLDDLTNYVYAITNFQAQYSSGTPTFKVYGYTNGAPSFLTNGVNIIGLLSTPEYTDPNNTNAPIYNPFTFSSYNSNHIVSYVRSISGPAVEKPPQDNSILQQDSFSYRILCVNAPAAVDTNVFNLSQTSPQRIYADQLTANLHELRLTFLWPQLPDGKVGAGHQTFRALIAGQLVQDANNNNLYFYQSQAFTNAP
ncbi:MAG: type II secretion system protein [Limisphaerales bacterium]